MTENQSPKSFRLIFGSFFLSTGAALVIYVVSGVSLVAALMLVLLIATILGALIWQKTGGIQRVEFKKSIQVGVIAGLLATIAYDISRFILIEVTGIAFWPFDIFSIFGKALVGAGYTGWWVTLAGVLYHGANGIGFGVAYTIWLGRKGIVYGILWALLLELCMVSIYPGWLGMKALDEFLQVSILGHFVYGIVLGYLAKWLLLKYDVYEQANNNGTTMDR